MELDPPNSSGPDDSANEPVFGRAAAPDHAPGFWASLEAEMHADAVASNTVVPGIEVAPHATEVLQVVPPIADPTDRTEQLATVGAGTGARSGSSWQVLAAAAALFVVALVGVGMLRGNGSEPGELVSAGEFTPGVASAASNDSQTTQPAATATSVPARPSASTAAAASQPDSSEADDDADAGADADTSNDGGSGAAQDDDGERFLAQSDQQLLYFAQTIPTGTANCVNADQNVVVVHAPDGSRTTLPGRVYSYVDQVVIEGPLFALLSTNCDGDQILEAGRIESDGRMVTATTIRGRVSDGAPAIFDGVNLDQASGSVSFAEAAQGTTDFSPQTVEIETPLRPTPVPTTTATPKPLPTASPEGSFFDRARLLGSSNDGKIDWFAVTDPSARCTDDDYSQIMVIAEGGPANTVHSPQYTYSGDLAFFAADDATSRVAFVASCGSQLEMHVATLGPFGTFSDSDLAWVGTGSSQNSLVLWNGETVTLNSLQEDGTPFFVAYEPASGRIVDTNIPSISVDDGGTPEGLFPSPVGASANGENVYYNGADPAGRGGCEGESNTLWVNNEAGDWLRAVPDDLELRIVGTLALEDSSAQVAFATGCEGMGGAFFVGLTQADGRIANIQRFSMSSYVPGFVSNLIWIDASRLRIETNNDRYDVDPKRFEYDLRADVMVQLDR